MRRSLARLLVLPLAVALGAALGPAAGASAKTRTATAVDYSAPGPNAAGYTDTTVSAQGRSFSARVWYPAASAGANTPVAAGRHPAVAFGHGFFQDISNYASTLQHLASWGFVVVAPKSQGGLFPNHSAFADDLNASLAWITAQDTTAGSRFAERVDTGRLAASGHSMGGGAALLAASRNPAIDTVTTLAAAETNPSAVAASRAITAPAQYVGGTDDTIVPVKNQQEMYAAKPAPAQLRVIKGGSHCGFEDSSGFGCDSGPLARPAQLSLVRKVTASWLRYTLAGDSGARDSVWGADALNDPQVAFTGKE